MLNKLFSYQIIKNSFKSVWIWWFISVFITSINLFFFPTMTGAENMDMLAMFAKEGIGGNGIIFITICAILFSNVLLTSEVDKGTLAIPLNTPATRLRILLSKTLVYILLLVSISFFVGALGALSPIVHSLKFDYNKWWVLIFLWSLYSFTVGGIAFFIGCWFNKSRYTISITATILGSFFFLSMFANFENFEYLKYFTMQTLYDVTKVLNGKNIVLQMVALVLIGLPFYITGTIRFLKKDLPL